MGKVHFKNNLMLITALLTALFLSSISTSVTRSLDGNDSSIMKSDASDGEDWLGFDDDNDGIINVYDMCPFWYDENCSILLANNNSMYSKILRGNLFENETVVDVEYSPDGKHIAVASKWYGVIIVNLVSHEVEKYFPLSSYYSELGYMSRTESVAFSNDGSVLAIFGTGGLLEISTGDWEILDVWGAGEFQSHFGGADIVFSPDDEQIAIAANYNSTVGKAYIWSRVGENTLSEFRIESNGIFYQKVAAIDYSKDGAFLALAQGNQFAIYDTTNWDLVTSFTNDNTSENCENNHRCSNYAKDLEFSNDGLYLAVSHFNSSIEVFSTNIVCQDCSPWELLPEKSFYVDEKFSLQGITFSPDSTSIISLWEGEYNGCYCGKIKIFEIHNNSLISFEINGEGILWDVAISPDGKSIAFGDNDAYRAYDADWKDLPDGTGLFTIELDSDSDGIRDSIDACDDTKAGAYVNNIGCSFPFGPSSEFLADEHLIEWFFLINLVFWFFIAYKFLKINGTKLSSIPWVLPLFFVLILTYGIFQIPGLGDEIHPTDEYYYCPDGTLVTYDELPSSGLSESEFRDKPPEHWCDGAVTWATELSAEAFTMYITTILVVCSALLVSVIVYSKQNSTFVSSVVNGAYSGAKKQVKKIHKQYKQKQNHKQQQMKLQTNQLNHNPVNQQKKQVQKFENQSTQILSPQNNKTVSLRDQSSRGDAPTIHQQKPLIADVTRPLNSELFVAEKTQTVTVDSKGITTIETGFSKVTLNKLTTEVTKIPQGTDQHEMFIQEIKNMIHLDSKGFDVGLIDYDHGVNPKIVTRYMGPSKLSDHYKTLSARGKKKMMEELLEQVAQIHKCGMVHRDLKPDNILVDARPRDGNHQFDAIIDYGIAMKINRKQIESYNTAATKFFGHPSQKESNFNASTGQDWFSLARIFALIIRGVDIDSLHAEIQISQTGLEMRNDISSLGFNDSVTKSISELIIFATNPQCDDNATIGKLAKTGKALSKLF